MRIQRYRQSTCLFWILSISPRPAGGIERTDEAVAHLVACGDLRIRIPDVTKDDVTIAQCRCLELPRAVSGRLAPAAIYCHRPGAWVLRARASERRARSVLHAGLKPSAECGDQSPLPNELT